MARRKVATSLLPVAQNRTDPFNDQSALAARVTVRSFALAGFTRFHELATRVRPARSQGDGLPVPLGKSGVSAVAVALDDAAEVSRVDLRKYGRRSGCGPV